MVCNPEPLYNTCTDGVYESVPIPPPGGGGGGGGPRRLEYEESSSILETWEDPSSGTQKIGLMNGPVFISLKVLNIL
jgi:hypothetical protein